MLSKYDPLIVSTSATHLAIRSLTHKRLQQISNLQQNSRPPTRVHMDDMDLSVFKNLSCKNLGPGCYKTPTPPPGPSCNFGYATRFKLSPPRSMSHNKSTNMIQANKMTAKYTPESKKKKLQKIMTQNRLNECISREAKRIIQSDKVEKLKDQINEKFNKAEVNKIKKMKKTVGISYLMILTACFTCQVLHKNLIRKKKYQEKIQRYLLRISVICRAFGKFKRSLVVAKRTIAYRTLKKFVPKYIQIFLDCRKKRYLAIVMDIIDNFSKYVSISRINYMVNHQIKLIQTTIKGYLEVCRFRKHALRIFWNKLDLKARRIPEKVQHYYISSYLSSVFADYLKKYKRMKRFAVFLTNQNEVLGDGDENQDLKIERPFFRIFYVRNVKKMIAKAWDEHEKWPGINFLEFPIKMEREIGAVSNQVVTTIKRRKTMMRSKKGIVTVKHQ